MALYRNKKTICDAITRVLKKDDRVIFAYLYGSMVSQGEGDDYDIGIYADPDLDPKHCVVDLQIAMHRETGLPPEVFDVHMLGDVIDQGDVFGLLYLKGVVEDGKILFDKAPDARAAFLERYGRRFRECEGLIQEVLV